MKNKRHKKPTTKKLKGLKMGIYNHTTRDTTKGFFGVGFGITKIYKGV